jgi:hypothetical protein
MRPGVGGDFRLVVAGLWGHGVMTLVYFGERWDAPVFDGVIARQVPTPIGKTCLFCQEEIAEGDRGFVQAGVTPLTRRGKTTGHQIASLYVHRECQLRSVLGGLEHLEGRCEYTGHCHVLREAAGRTIRQDALAVWDRVHGVGEVTESQ